MWHGACVEDKFWVLVLWFEPRTSDLVGDALPLGHLLCLRYLLKEKKPKFWILLNFYKSFYDHIIFRDIAHPMNYVFVDRDWATHYWVLAHVTGTLGKKGILASWVRSTCHYVLVNRVIGSSDAITAGSQCRRKTLTQSSFCLPEAFLMKPSLDSVSFLDWARSLACGHLASNRCLQPTSRGCQSELSCECNNYQLIIEMGLGRKFV